MTTVEILNSVIERYLRSSTERYLELGEYTSPSDCFGRHHHNTIETFIEVRLIRDISHSWYGRIYDIGKWRYDPMFRHMYNLIISSPVLIMHMIDIIHEGRRQLHITDTMTDYEPVTIMRHYAFHYARLLDKSFFTNILDEYFNPVFRPTGRRRYDGDTDVESDDDDSSTDSDTDDDDDEIPPPTQPPQSSEPTSTQPTQPNETKPTRIPPPA